MKNFKSIDKCDVWSHLQAGKQVIAVVFNSRKFSEGLHDLQFTRVTLINELLEEENTIFYERIEKGEKDD